MKRPVYIPDEYDSSKIPFLLEKVEDPNQGKSPIVNSGNPTYNGLTKPPDIGDFSNDDA